MGTSKFWQHVMSYKQEIDLGRRECTQLLGTRGCVCGLYLGASKGAYISIPPSSWPTMSTAPSTSSNFVSIFNAALESYKRKTKKDLASHPLLPTLQSCDSPEAVLAVLRDQVPAFGQSQNRDDGLTRWVTPTVNVLCSFSETIGQGVGLVNILIF